MNTSLLKEYKERVSKKISNKDFLNILFDAYNLDDIDVKKAFCKYCLQEGIVGKFKMNVLSTRLLIDIFDLTCEA